MSLLDIGIKTQSSRTLLTLNVTYEYLLRQLHFKQLQIC